MKFLLLAAALLLSGTAEAKSKLGNIHYHSVISGPYRHQDQRCKIVIHEHHSGLQTNHCKFWLKND